MPEFEEDVMQASAEQLALLRELGADDPELEDLSYADADELIAELRAMREDAGRVGRD